MKKRQHPPQGAPAWVLTYGDMMSLLLCFFILLAAMSEVRKGNEFAKALQSIQQAFGFEIAGGVVASSAPLPVDGGSASLIEQLRRLRRLPTSQNTDGDSTAEETPKGASYRVTNVREGIQVVIGGGITFDGFSADLKPEAEDLVAQIGDKVRGYNTKINVRGHATPETPPPASPYPTPRDLSYARARAVAEVLERNGVRPERLRVIACGDTEPLARDAYTEERLAANRRVEIVVTEALADEYSGSAVDQR